MSTLIVTCLSLLESVALESLTPELVKNISPPGSKLCGVDELKLELRSRGLPVSGTKKELVDRLREDDNKVSR